MPVLETLPTVQVSVVCDRREAAPGIVVLGIRAPTLAQSVRPGQFAMVLAPGGERSATALGIYEAAGERVSLLLVTVGPRTHALASLGVGDTLNVCGPLGNGFDLAALGADVALIAGGVGIASLLTAAQWLRQHATQVTLYYGARTAAALVDAERFEALGVPVAFASDDGSRGHRGVVTELLERSGRVHSGIAACGPSPMLRAVGRISASLGIRAQLALEETFACGVGACWGCVVAHAAGDGGRACGLIGTTPPASALQLGPKGAWAYVRICKEGPVFWAHELRW